VDVTPQLVIMILTLVGFMAMGVWALVWGRRVDWPDDAFRTVYKSKNLRVLVFVDHAVGADRAGFDRLAKRAHLAIKIADEEIRRWRKSRGKQRSWIANLLWPYNQPIKEFAVHYPTDYYYDEKIDSKMKKYYQKGTNATLGQLHRAVGSGPRIATIRNRFIQSTVDRGSPLIHEVCHTAASDSLHSHPGLWIEGARKWNALDPAERKRRSEYSKGVAGENRLYDPELTVEAIAYKRFNEVP
jgi:hypothetical protein